MPLSWRLGGHFHTAESDRTRLYLWRGRYDGSVAYDAVIVPGGGVREGDELPPWVKDRFDVAIERSGEAPIVCLLAGTVHRPNPLDQTGRAIFEASAGAQYLLRKGFPAERIYIELASWDTVGNAYFARTVHTDPSGWRRLLVITSEHHVARAE